VRTPMQWSAAPNGGFSSAPARKLVRPLPGGLFSPDHVNAYQQRRDPDSLWNYMRRLIRVYRQMPQIGWSTVEILDHEQPAVLAHVCHCDGWRLVALHNLGPDTCTVTITLDDLPEGALLRDALDVSPGMDEDVPVSSGTPVELRIEGYAGRWLRVLAPGEECFL
jgi:glycosidase